MRALCYILVDKEINFYQDYVESRLRGFGISYEKNRDLHQPILDARHLIQLAEALDHNRNKIL